jgi:hypothetical protein
LVPAIERERAARRILSERHLLYQAVQHAQDKVE